MLAAHFTPDKAAYLRIFWCMAIAMAVVSGCTSLLPEGRQDYQSPWPSYADAEGMFEKITPGQTRLKDLKALGLDPKSTPNIVMLAHPDLLRRLTGNFSVDPRIFDILLRACLDDQSRCFAFEIEHKKITRKRYGNFWLDFLNFDRKVDVSGWEFQAIIVIHGDTVAYKIWSGKPNLHQIEQERNPLGPLQGIGTSILGK